MAKFFVKLIGLNKVFNAKDNILDLHSIKSDMLEQVGYDSIMFITATSDDEQYGFKSGSKYIWAQNELYPTNGMEELEYTSPNDIQVVAPLTKLMVTDIVNGEFDPSDYEMLSGTLIFEEMEENDVRNIVREAFDKNYKPDENSSDEQEQNDENQEQEG